MNIDLREFTEEDLPDAQRWCARRGLPADESGLRAELLPGADGRGFVVELYGTPIGLAGLRRIDRAAGEAEGFIIMGEVGYNNLRGTTGAAEVLLRTAFTALQLRRVRMTVPAGDEPLYERLGFQRLGGQTFAVTAGDFRRCDSLL